LLDSLLNEGEEQDSGGTTDEAFHCTLDDGDGGSRADRPAGGWLRPDNAADSIVTDRTGADHIFADVDPGSDIRQRDQRRRSCS
jgi:hypothetical protein